MTQFPVPVPSDFLPLPNAIETISQKALLQAWKDKFVTLWPAYNVYNSELDPGTVIAEAYSYLRMLDRSRVNDAYRALRLALAQGSNLDGLAADRGVVRLTLLPAMGPNPAVMEGDASLLLRTWLKMQAWGTGSVFGVEYHARTLGIVQGASVGKLTLADAKVIDFPGQGRMACTLLPVSGLAAADAEIMRSTIGNTLMDRMRRPGSISIDTVLATIVTVNYAGVLKIRRGVSPVDAPIAARTALQNYMLTRRRVGALVPVSTMQAVQLDYGVVEAQASDPPADVIVPDTAAAELGTVQIETQVIDD